MQYHLNGFVPGDPDIAPARPAHNVGENGLCSYVDVIIAGCGPAGLCLAAQLARYRNISTMIVEPKSGPMEKGQADGISVRSMEMFQTFGFAEKLSRESVWINETTFWTPNPSDPSKIALACLTLFDPVRQFTDHCRIFFPREVWTPFALLTFVHKRWHVLMCQKAPCHRFIKHAVHCRVVCVECTCLGLSSHLGSTPLIEALHLLIINTVLWPP